MKKLSATKAQIRRAVETLEAMGKVVAGVRCHANGDADVLIGEPLAGTVAPDNDDVWGEFDKAHGHG